MNAPSTSRTLVLVSLPLNVESPRTRLFAVTLNSPLACSPPSAANVPPASVSRLTEIKPAAPMVRPASIVQGAPLLMKPPP